MAFNTKSIVKDLNQKPIPQYYNPVTDTYEVLQGSNGANRAVLYDADGNPVDLSKLVQKANMEYYGKSTDLKPTSNIIVGSTYFEIDTISVSMWDGTGWVVI
jgi:hypothetical protein